MTEINQLFEERIQNRLNDLQITSFSKVQQECIPHALKGEDIFAQAPTGSGKTYAYLLPILQRLQFQGKGKHFPQVVILSPTRELCLQIASVTRSLLEKTEGIRTSLLTGGVDMNAQVKAFSKGADIVIGTPSRICDHLRRHTLKTKHVSMLVLDEADVMLSMGFLEDVQQVCNALPAHQTYLFSATYQKDIQDLAKEYLNNPYECHIEQEALLEQHIQYEYHVIAENRKFDYLKKQIKERNGSFFVFCNTRKTTDFIAKLLQQNGIQAEGIHSDMDYKKRKQIMQDFRNHSLHVLCATDVAARGIDIPSVENVISYDSPDAFESLIHRFGRTGRAQHEGYAIVYLTPQQRSLIPTLQKQFPQIKQAK